MLLPNMALVSSTARNVGKTTFCTAFIDKWKHKHSIIGLKVTAVSGEKGTCHHGNSGCGVCTSFTGDFEIIEETQKNGAKDTMRLLSAGASKVFWVKAMKAHVSDALLSFMRLVPENCVIVCESNALADIVRPGVCVLMHKSGVAPLKPSATSIAKVADFIADITDIKNLNIAINKIDINEKSEPTFNSEYKDFSLVILAGGKSSRMGKDKQSLLYNGTSFLECIAQKGFLCGFSEVIISGSNEKVFAVKNVLDELPDRGPLGGIHAGLKAAKSKYCFVTAVDTPKIDFDALVPMAKQHKRGLARATLLSHGGKLDPLIGVYNSSLHNDIFDLIKDGPRKIIDLFIKAEKDVFDYNGDVEIIDNINTPEDYNRLVNTSKQSEL